MTEFHCKGMMYMRNGIAFGVFDLREVHRMNPDFDWYKSRPWTTTLIRDFTGKVTIELKGKDSVRVVGRGNINFFSAQTSF